MHYKVKKKTVLIEMTNIFYHSKINCKRFIFKRFDYYQIKINSIKNKAYKHVG